MIRLISTPQDPLGDKWRRLLRFKQLEFEDQSIDFFDNLITFSIDEQFTRRPILEIEGKRLVEPSQILDAIDRVAPNPLVWPTAAEQLALARILADWADKSLHFHQLQLRYVVPTSQRVTVPSLTAKESPWAKVAATVLLPWQARAVTNRQGTGLKSLPDLLIELAELMTSLSITLGSKDWLVGDQLSFADISVYVQVLALNNSEEAAELIVPHNNLYQWMHRVDAATR